MKKKGILQVIAAIVFFLASWWCLLWVFSSAHLAFLACDGKYSLFHEHFRCRQPYIAQILWISFGIACITLFFLGVKNIRQHKNNEKNT